MTKVLTIAAAMLLAGAVGAGAQTADKQTGDKVDGKALASPTQQKPAYEPQQPVPGDTPEETSTKTDSDNFVTGKDQGRSPERSGSSAPAAKKDGAAK